ncbi:MAG TPA: fibronectin type III domain-containing protein [Acidimicrobiales bacterium]
MNNAGTGQGPAGGVSGDEGFTLIELLAAMTVLALGVVGVIGVTNSSMKVAADAGARSKAVSVATQVIEEYRALPYDSIPTGSEPGATGRGRQVPVGTRTFSVDWHIDMVDETAAADPAQTATTDAYKSLTVTVSWTDDRYREVRQETIIYPGGRGRHVPVAAKVPNAPPGTPAAPSDLVLTIPAGLTGTTAVDLAWVSPVASNPPIEGFVVQYSTDYFVTTQYEVSTSNPTPYFRVTDLSAGTAYQFRVASVAANGTTSGWTGIGAISTPANPLAPCRLGLSSVTPKAVHKRGSGNGSKLTTSPRLAVNTIGNCLTTTLRAEYSPRAGVTRTIALTADDGVFEGTINGEEAWDVGRHDIVIRDGTLAERGSTVLLVCDATKRSCR